MTGQRGRRSRFTADEVAEIRRVYWDYQVALQQRRRVIHELRVGRDEFARIGRGLAGKKPRAS